MPNTGSPVHGYVATNGTTGTKTDTPLMQTPASISVITHDQIVDQDAQSVAQALRYAPGVIAEQRGTNTDTLEYLYSRGFLADTYMDGLRLPPSSLGFNTTSHDVYLIDHIESLRGPASILYGQTPPGGIVNIVSKLPQETPFNEIFFQSGSYGRIQAGFDSTGPLNDAKTLLYRVTGVGLNTGTQTDFVNEQRIAIAPSFTWKIDPDTKLTAYINYQKDPQGGNYNFVPAAGTVLPGTVKISRSMDLGDPGFDRNSKEEVSAGYSFEHHLTDVWDLKQNFRFLHSDQTLQQINSAGNPTNGGTVLPRVAYINQGAIDSVTVDNEAIASFNTGALKHKALFGVDYQFTEYDHYLYYGYTNASVVSPSLNLLAPAYNLPIATPNRPLGTSSAVGLQQTGVYAQDQISLGKLTVVGGLREDFASINTYSYNTATTTNQDWNALTGRFGILYSFDSGITPYFSYATSFQPAAGTTDTGAPLKPTDGEQYEVGVKYQAPGTKSYVTLAAFDLRQTNVSVSNALYIGSITQTGEVRSKGVEFEAHAYLTDRLQAIGTYTYDGVVNTVATAALIGKAPTGIPLNMASGFLTYDMPDTMAPGLKLSGGVRYLDSTFGDTANTFKVPSVTLVDLGVQYDFGRDIPQAKGWSGNVNVTNLFDKSYIASCVDASDCVFGAGRLVLAGLKYRW